jgi:hypothetical protein
MRPSPKLTVLCRRQLLQPPGLSTVHQRRRLQQSSSSLKVVPAPCSSTRHKMSSSSECHPCSPPSPLSAVLHSALQQYPFVCSFAVCPAHLVFYTSMFYCLTSIVLSFIAVTSLPQQSSSTNDLILTNDLYFSNSVPNFQFNFSSIWLICLEIHIYIYIYMAYMPRNMHRTTRDG